VAPAGATIGITIAIIGDIATGINIGTTADKIVKPVIFTGFFFYSNNEYL
jgi:hypothetical protein